MYAKGVLLLYHHPLRQSATTVREHVEAFCRHSQFKVWSVNTELGFPEGLDRLSFQGVLLHYSLFGPRYEMNEMFLEYLERDRKSYKIAFFQDEHRYCKKRFDFLNHFKVDCVFTLIEPPYHKETYNKYTRVPKLVYTIPGYVSDALIDAAQRKTIPDKVRKIDIGYRGRKLECYMGKGSQEKYQIAADFMKRACSLGLRLDIEAEEGKRIYGSAWSEFIANCRGVLGVEAGVSVFDLEDVVYRRYRELLVLKRQVTPEDLSKELEEWEDRIPYRTISPRHFEAAALRSCQILFEGKYSGILQPALHYLALKKDFSNFDEVVRSFRDSSIRQELTENAYRDLIASGRYSYSKFIGGTFDETLVEAGLENEISSEEAGQVTDLLTRDQNQRIFYARIRGMLYHPFPGRRTIISLIKPVVSLIQKSKHEDRWKLPIS